MASRRSLVGESLEECHDRFDNMQAEESERMTNQHNEESCIGGEDSANQNIITEHAKTESQSSIEMSRIAFNIEEDSAKMETERNNGVDLLAEIHGLKRLRYPLVKVWFLRY